MTGSEVKKYDKSTQRCCKMERWRRDPELLNQRIQHFENFTSWKGSTKRKNKYIAFVINV